MQDMVVMIVIAVIVLLITALALWFRSDAEDDAYMEKDKYVFDDFYMLGKDRDE